MFRVGLGYDIHRLIEGRKLVLGGVEIGFSKGLDGHSDADALLHAVCDACLGAAGLGDIGQHFPDTDPRYKGADSKKLLAEAWSKVKSLGYRLANMDCVVIAEAPKLGPHFPSMRQVLAEIFSCDSTCVNLKAKTNEKLGYLGNQEAIAVHCVVLLENSQRVA